MAVIYKKIRIALENKLNSISGIPPIAWENVDYVRTSGTSFIEPMMMPTLREPAHRGLNPQMYYRGVFRINIYTPRSQGASAGETIAETIISNFEATTDIITEENDSLLTQDDDLLLLQSGDEIVLNGLTVVSIEYADQEQGIPDGSFYVIPLNVGYYIYN
jgi:hypothetical protein